MVQLDRIFGGLFSSQSFKQDNSYVYNQYDVRPRISVDTKNTYNQDTAIHINSSKTQMLSMPGSHNHGVQVNDPHINMTNIFDRPMIFNMQAYPLLFFSLLLVLLILLFVVVLAWVYHRNQRRRRRRRRHQETQSNESK